MANILFRCYINFFFLLWNRIFGVFSVQLVTEILRRGFYDWVDICIRLIWPPHTAIGLVVPIFFVRAKYILPSPLEKAIFITTAYVIPLTYWTIKINFPTRWGGSEDFRD